MKTVGVIEARMGSSRVPGKMLLPLAGKPLFEQVARRALACRSLDAVVLATTTDARDGVLEAWAGEVGIACWRGSEEDVLVRVLEAARFVEGDVIVKLSGDNPLYHAEYVDPIVDRYLAGGADFVTNTAMGFSKAWNEDRTWPIGTGANVFATDLLEACLNEPIDQSDREHVIKYFVEHPEKYRLVGFPADGAFAKFRRPELRFAIDTPADFAFCRAIFHALSPRDPLFGLSDVIAFLDEKPELMDLVRGVVQKPL